MDQNLFILKNQKIRNLKCIKFKLIIKNTFIKNKIKKFILFIK